MANVEPVDAITREERGAPVQQRRDPARLRGERKRALGGPTVAGHDDGLRASHVEGARRRLEVETRDGQAEAKRRRGVRRHHARESGPTVTNEHGGGTLGRQPSRKPPAD